VRVRPRRLSDWRGGRDPRGDDVGQALFFTTARVLTISSSLANPVTALGRVVDLLLELWGVLVVAGTAGAVATFFLASDAS